MYISSTIGSLLGRGPLRAVICQNTPFHHNNHPNPHPKPTNTVAACARGHGDGAGGAAALGRGRGRRGGAPGSGPRGRGGGAADAPPACGLCAAAVRQRGGGGRGRGTARRTEPAGTSGEAGPSSRRGKAPPSTLSVAAAALEDEDGDDDGSHGAEQESPFAGDSPRDDGHATGRSANGANTSTVDGARPLGSERHVFKQGEPSTTSTVAKAATLPPSSQPTPEITMPRFSARRPAVVVKRKVEPAKPPSPKADPESPGLQGLLGGYGSSESD